MKQSPAARSHPQPTKPTPQSRARGRIRASRPPTYFPDRSTALGRVLPLWPHELEDESAGARKRVVDCLRHALRAERRRGVAGNWTYDLARHVELLRLYTTEMAALAGAQDARVRGANRR
jgi:hypothetical protein